MIRPARDSLIALILTLAGLAAFAFGLSRLLTHGENDVPGGASAVLGGLTALIALPITLNFLYALRLARRLERGQGVIARWTVPADLVAAYRAAEKALAPPLRSRWRPSPGPAEILFATNGVLAGGHYLALSAKRLATYAGVHHVPGDPPTIQFSTREVTVVGDRIGQHHDILRLPVPPEGTDRATAVVTHFRQALATAADERPAFWRSRLRIGQGMVLASLAAGAAGWYLADRAGWRGEDPLVLPALVLMIAGVLVALAGLFLTALSARFLRQR